MKTNQNNWLCGLVLVTGKRGELQTIDCVGLFQLQGNGVNCSLCGIQLKHAGGSTGTRTDYILI